MKTRISTIIFLLAMTALLAAVACGSSSTAPVPNQPPPTETPVKGPPPPEEPPKVEVPAPIEGSTVVPPATPGGDYVLKISSGLPSGCAEFSGYEIKRDGTRFMVEVTNLMPHPSLTIACTDIYGYHNGEVVLGSGLADGGTYTVDINSEWTHLFIAEEVGGQAMVEKESPIEDIEVTRSDGIYTLNVISRLPKGSSCSMFNGYTINRRFAERIEVSLTHLEVTADNIPCTADLPVVVTEIILGVDLAEAQTYTVSVNGTETTFSEEELASVEVPAPIENASVKPPEAVGGDYSLKVTSGLPSGCARFSDIQVERDGNEFLVEVTNRVPNPKEPVACTAVYGYHDSEISLGDGLNVGEGYTVIINGESAVLFNAQDADGLAMVEKESQIRGFLVNEVDGRYTLTVYSALPRGSGCSRFDGYEIDRRSAGRIEVTVTHLEAKLVSVPCSTDLSIVTTEIPLGENFESGRTYTVSVNGGETDVTPR